MFRLSDSHFHGVGLVDKPYQEEIGTCSNDTSNNDTEEHDSHHTEGKAVHVDVHPRERFKKRVLQVINIRVRSPMAAANNIRRFRKLEPCTN